MTRYPCPNPGCAATCGAAMPACVPCWYRLTKRSPVLRRRLDEAWKRHFVQGYLTREGFAHEAREIFEEMQSHA